MEINNTETHARTRADSLLEAVEFAVKHHGQQVRKFSGEPYVLHPIRVARTLLRHEPDCSTHMLYAALLHDLLEDSKTVTRGKIIRRFGPETLRLVNELTNDPEQIESIGKTLYLCQKITELDDAALTIKLCDRLDNISDLKPSSQEDKWSTEYAGQTYKILAALRKSGRAPVASLVTDIHTRLNDLGYHELV